MLIMSGCVIGPLQADEPAPTPNPATVPSLAIAPMSGPPGTNIIVAGAGWQPREVVYVNLEAPPAPGAAADAEVQRATVVITTTTDIGQFVTNFVYPSDPAWNISAPIEIAAYSFETKQRAAISYTLTILTPSSTTTATSAATTATPTGAAPASTPTWTPTPRPANQATVTSNALNLRRGPATAFGVIRTLPAGTNLIVNGQNANGDWLLVRVSDGTEGWVARGFTSFRNNAPVVPTPPFPPTPTPTQTPIPTPVITGWRGEYYSNRNLNGNPVSVRNDLAIDFDWGAGAPGPGLPADNYSARWTRTLNFEPGRYRFLARADDGVRVWIDNELVIDQWRESTARTYTVERTLSAGSHAMRVEYFEATGGAQMRFGWEFLQTFPDWRGEYYANGNLTGPASIVRNDTDLDFNWGAGAPAPGLPNDNFSARWTRTLNFEPGVYRFQARADDGVRIFVDDNLVLDRWQENVGDTVYTTDVELTGSHRVRVEYFERVGGALVEVFWQRLTGTPTATVTPTATTVAATATPTLTNTPVAATATATLLPTETPTVPAATETPTTVPPEPTATETATTAPPEPTATETATETATTAIEIPTETPTETPTP